MVILHHTSQVCAKLQLTRPNRVENFQSCHRPMRELDWAGWITCQVVIYSVETSNGEGTENICLDLMRSC